MSDVAPDLADANSGTTAVREGYAFDEAALTAWLEANVEGFAGPLSVEQFKGGQSNPTYKLVTPSRSYVLRRKPPGQLLKGAHAVEREAKVLSALHGAGFPVAKVYGLCEDDGVIGTWFYVMEMVEGRIFWDATVPGVSNEERAALFDAMNATMAQLHSCDPEAIGLGDYGRPGNYFARQVSRWSKQYFEDEAAGRNPDMDAVIAWLEANMPADDGASSVIHGDFRIDNMIFHPTEPRVLAVLDWELSTLGHPLADFAYNAMMYHMPPHIVAGLGGADIAALGIPSEEDYVAAYCRRTGREGLPDYRYYMAFNFFRLAAIFHGIKGRVIRGTASNAQAKERAEAFPELARLALGFTRG
ncbi:phosphotransferase [Novosphingobium resinovorum]|uniref:Aminoglycoside phosphotransferase n=1 Tax=Novosphingobium resinovorum TaxID=158500 RepID=A0A1D8A033_9SPHN|nr:MULTISPECIES: phosphotransferase [Novosphingobium]AOR75478.1 aminoglycoside phosphotransferase [Novosphingobium resinovorum]MBF7010792.1 phosphotransferase [Novosphingobium sp. HR1a]WJM28787.1 phosphotransferase [Novosphingobium resinovorum]